MDQNEAPVLDALAEHQQLKRYGFTPPAHRQGRGVDPRVLEVLGEQSFKSDVVASSGLDDRKSSNGYLSNAESLMAEAVGADKAFFTTCGSSLSVKAAMLAVTRGEGELLISRDAHKSVSVGLVLSGLQPRWIRPQWDEDLKLPLLLPGERINQAAIDYLRNEVEAGMVLPDPADSTLKTIRVVREEPHQRR
jgi:arginine/lysine/ornithine decarboxylase